MRRLLSILPPQHGSKLRSFYHTGKQQFVKRFLSYGTGELAAGFRKLGAHAGDTLMVHSSFDTLSGFKGSPSDFIETILEVIGSTGNLLMVSLPYRSSTYEYLRKSKIFDVRKTASQMGLISETFRRRKGVLRSLHPTHPVLAAGAKAEWIVSGHERCVCPCGAGTPFDKLAALNGKVVFFNASFYTFTFFHYLEEMIVKDRLSFPLFLDEPFMVPMIDHQGLPTTVKTYVYSLEANRRRHPEVLRAEFEKGNLLKRVRVGNSRILMVETQRAIACVEEMTRQGTYFYDLS
jgi:aminoglycoside 3-N-acetyltransferase